MENNQTPLNIEQQYALEKMLDGNNVFLTGPAGTGKSAVIRAFMQQCRKNLVCLAPTGLAALNLGKATTIHHFFEFGATFEDRTKEFSPSIFSKIASADVFLFDEISMVSSALLFEINRSLCMATEDDRPFGGKQIIVSGDFYQLPPVIPDEEYRKYIDRCFGSEFAFTTRAWDRAAFVKIVLKQFMRQQDPYFVHILQAARYCSGNTRGILSKLNTRVLPRPDHTLTLCCKRCDADRVNHMEVSKLKDAGRIYTGSVSGSFPAEDMPTNLKLQVKKGEDVMLLVNHANLCGYDYVNGDIGTVMDYDDSSVMLSINGRTVCINPYRWIKYDYHFDEESETLSCTEIGSFRQFPIIPAYATTIHKSQGLTLNRIHIDLGSGCFTGGQLYTALTRVRDLNGITLEVPVKASDLMVNPLIEDFNQDDLPNEK